MRKGLSLVGEPSLLRGLSCGRVHLAHNADLYSANDNTVNDNHVVRYTVVSIDRQYNPRVGDLLVHPEGSYVLDRLLDENGVVLQFIVAAA